MFIPPNPNDRPVKERQFALIQFVVLITLASLWSAALRVTLHPETSPPLRQFLSVLVAIGGVAGVIYFVMLVFRFLRYRPALQKKASP